MKDESAKQPDELTINEASAQQPELEQQPAAVAQAAIPANLDLGSGYHSLSEPSIETPEVADRATGELGGLLDRIRNKVSSAVSGSDGADGRPRTAVKVTKKQQGEFMELARLALSPLLILAVTQSLGDVCAPTKEEADQFVEPLSRIIARHVPIPDHMSADLIDMLGMVSIGIVWYTRVSTDLPWNNKGGDDNSKPPRKPTGGGDNGRASAEQDNAIVSELLSNTTLDIEELTT